MRNVTVRQLQVFVEAAKKLSFARTSESLHLTPAAVSLQIKQMEGQAGLPLFERLGKRLHLTAAGETLLRHAQQVLRTLDDAEESLAALKGLRGGRLRIAVLSTTKYFAPGLLALFRDRYPEIEIILTINNREVVIQSLAQNEADIAIMGRPPMHFETEATPIARHPQVIIASPRHPLAGRKRIAPSALADETFLVRESGSGTRMAMEEYFRAQGISPRIGMEIASNETIKQAVMAGMGLSFISRHTIGLELETGHLVELAVRGLPVMRDWYLVHLKSKHLDPAAAAFKRFVPEAAAELLRGAGAHNDPDFRRQA